MIQTNELMLGNYVLHNDKPIKVEGITENRIMTFANKTGVRLLDFAKPEDINPIPITEEILEKCGFDKHADLSVNKKEYFSNLEDQKIVYYEESDCYLLVGCTRYFKYLHELQNIYFLLNKEPLNIEF